MEGRPFKAGLSQVILKLPYPELAGFLYWGRLGEAPRSFSPNRVGIPELPCSPSPPTAQELSLEQKSSLLPPPPSLLSRAVLAPVTFARQ